MSSSPASPSTEATALRESEDAACSVPISSLPALPTPHHFERLSESALGVTVVLLLISLFVGLTHGVAVGDPPQGAWWAPLALIYVEAFIALVALAGLLFGDPGVVKRSPATCYPIPGEVLTRLLNGESLEGLSNVRLDDRTYCIRCLVWRPEAHESRFSGSSTCHHCQTCQRCVRDFDHHCGVFGRCIAGKGLSGNMKWFKTILTMAGAALVTTILPLILKLVAIAPRRVQPNS